MESVILAVLLLVVSAAPAHSYRDITHRTLSRQATSRSVLPTSTFAKALGGASGPLPGDIHDPIADGNLAEDRRTRPSNHFFNPLTGQGFTHWPTGQPATGWALGVVVEENTNVFANESDGRFLESRRSFRSAREQLYKALTSSTASARRQAARETLRLLGQVTHVLQDMAQPQHVRNDNHFELPFGFGLVTFSFEHPSRYEAWVEEHINNINLQEYPAPQIPRPQDYWTVLYDEGHTDFDNNDGLADFTNHNFVSIATNFRHDPTVMRPEPGIPIAAEILSAAAFPKPDNLGATIVPGTWSGALFSDPFPVGDPAVLNGSVVYYIGTPVLDTLGGEIPSGFNDYTSTLGILDPDLESVCSASASCDNARFTLDNANYNAAAQFLLPRAIGYTSGLLNHFARGIVHGVVPNEDLTLHLGLFTFGNAAFAGITNTSGEDLLNGRLRVFYDSFDGSRKELGSKEINIPAGSTAFIESSDINWFDLWTGKRASGGSVVFAYVGDMGAERAPLGDLGKEYMVAGRVCTCPPQADSNDPNDPQLECFNFCCQYLSFTNGDPGFPGDGRTVMRDAFQHLYLYPPIDGGVLTDGFTLTVFPTASVPGGMILSARGASDAPCSAFGTCVYPYANYIGGEIEGTVTVNGTVGYYVRFPASAIITSDTCSCGSNEYALDDLLNVFPCLGSCDPEEGCTCSASTIPIDAVALCRHVNRVPE